MLNPPPLPDGFCVVRYRCTGCSTVIYVLSLYRNFPPGTGNGHFHHSWDLAEALERFRAHLSRHWSEGQPVSLKPECEESLSAS